MQSNAKKSADSEVYGCSQAKLPISRELSDPPENAWPTVLLALVGVTTYVATHVAYSQGLAGYGPTGWLISYPTALALWSVSAYVCFTPMHDASHGAIASSKSAYRALNPIVGRLCGLTLCAPFTAFRCLHMRHHKYTNVRGKDPDLWSSAPAIVARYPWLAFMMPLLWISQIWGYIGHYLAIRNERPKQEVQETVLLFILTAFYPLISLVRFGSESYAFWCYGFPGYLAIMFLAMCFDYLPHRPHGTTDIYEGSNLTALTATYKDDGTGKKTVVDYVTSPLTPILLWQNYHIVHHLYPWIPFYRYAKVWYVMEKELLAAKVPIVPLVPLVVPKKNA